MHKESLFFYFFRLSVTFGIFCVLAMLYWSSLLVEEDIKKLKLEIQEVKNIFQKKETFCSPHYPSDSLDSKDTHSFRSSTHRPHIDSSFTNVLQEDLFFTKTLPQLLNGRINITDSQSDVRTLSPSSFSSFVPSGIRRGATIGKPADLHPFTNWAQASEWVSLCSVSLARLSVGKYETMAPDMAIKIEERPRKNTQKKSSSNDTSSLTEYWVHLREGVFWQPLTEMMFEGKVTLAPHFLKKHPVTAEDFKFFFDALMNPSVQTTGAVALRTYLADIEEIEVIDPLTFIVRWKPKELIDSQGNKVEKVKYVAKQLTGSLRPLASFVYKYFPDGSKIIEDDSAPDIYRTHSVWAQNFMEHWAKQIIPSCGGWVFEKMTDEQISFKRNPDHYSPYDVLVSRMEVAFRNTPDSIWQDFKTNRIDTYTLQPNQLIELANFLKSNLYRGQKEEGTGIGKIEYPGRSFAYLGWNQARPFFKSERVRQAMTLAIDRQRLIQQYLNGMGAEITGPFSEDSSAYDHSIAPWPFDPLAAKRILEEEGWVDSDGDGVLDKIIDGERVPFRFGLTYFVKNPTTKSVCEYVVTALKEIGVQVNLNGVDIADLSADIDGKNFDALCMGWQLGTPPEDPRQLWHSSGAKEAGSSNLVGFSNKEADQIIDQLTFEDNPEKRVHLYHRFHHILHEEQPYTFLYAQKNQFLYREYVQNVFIPKNRQDLIPGADIAEPVSSLFWIRGKD